MKKIVVLVLLSIFLAFFSSSIVSLSYPEENVLCLNIYPKIHPQLYSPSYFLWGSSKYERATDFVLDRAGNIYIVGEVNLAPLNTDILLVKLDANGNELWNRTWGGSREDIGRGIALANDGSIYIVGSYYARSGNIYQLDLVLMKWNSNGNLIWTRTWERYFGSWENGYGITISEDGDIYTIGDSDGDLILIKWDSYGRHHWTQILESENYIATQGLAIAEDDNDYIYTLGTISRHFGGLNTFDDFLLVKWDATGQQLWNRTWGSNNFESPTGLCVSANGSIYTIGERFLNNGGINTVLVRWDIEGNQIWNNTLEDVEGAEVITANNSIYTIGSTVSWEEQPDSILIKWENDGRI
ncbi:MAG: hypothetical protein ACFFBD_28575, partial [Candidatus Hodarchaeota archaeon]